MANPPPIDIDRLPEAELIGLNRRIVVRLKMIAALLRPAVVATDAVEIVEPSLHKDPT